MTISSFGRYDPDEDWEELEGEEAQCSNCYHEKDFPHETLVLDKHTQRTYCLNCHRQKEGN